MAVAASRQRVFSKRFELAEVKNVQNRSGSQVERRE
jgi:hypothetical protein